MLRSLLITFVYLSFFVVGITAPFVLSLGYVWVDTFRPQDIAYSIINQIPVSLIMGAAAVGSYLLLDRRAPARISAHTVLILSLAVWVTITTQFFAVVPASAWGKWDWAFKTIVFSAFIPLVFRSLVQIEAFLQVYLFSVSIHILPVAAKTILSGGGYGRALGVVGADSGFSESSSLAAVGLFLVPIALYLRNNTLLVPDTLKRYFQPLYLGLAGACLACAMGTFARTAVVGMVVLAVALWLRSRRKVVGLVAGLAVVASLTALTSDQWTARISTIQDYRTEGSALGRILVWRWTLGFVADHPAGGGFNSYEVNELTMPGPTPQDEPVIIRGKAFHSIYFEVLGEHGLPGAALYGGLILTTLLSLQRTARRVRHVPELARCRDLAYALQVSFLTYLACGCFIGVAFQPVMFYSFALAACLAEYVRRSLNELGRASPAVRSWRSATLAPAMRLAPR